MALLRKFNVLKRIKINRFYCSQNNEITDPSSDPNNPIVVGYDRILEAEKCLKDGIVHTSCTKSRLDKITGMEVYFKREFEQWTGSFKERGARFAMLKIAEEDKQNGVVTASAGNHAQGVAFHGKQLGIKVTVVMPVTSPIMKIKKCQAMGAEVVLHGNDLSEAKAESLRIMKANHKTFINGYDNPNVIAGQGTVALEILQQVCDFNAVIVPTGGGGMLAGVCVGIKETRPEIQVIGVEAENCPSFFNALQAGQPVYTPALPTLAEGLAVPQVGYNAFATAKCHIDRMITVKEIDLARAILMLAEHEKLVIEGAGAVGLAAVLSNQLPELKGKKVVIILSGANIDTTTLIRVFDRALAAEGRLIKFSLNLSDRSGSLGDFLTYVGCHGVVIRDVSQERAWNSNVYSVKVTVIGETSDLEHSLDFKDKCTQSFKEVKFHNFPF